MSKAVMYGINRAYVPNSQADKHWRHKAWSRKQEAVQRENRKVKAETDAFEKEFNKAITEMNRGLAAVREIGKCSTADQEAAPVMVICRRNGGTGK